MAFIHKHLEIHNFEPKGLNRDMIKKDLKDNLDEVDYNYVKHLGFPFSSLY